MPTWGRIGLELNEIAQHHLVTAPGAPSPFDILRRKYLSALHRHTGRAVIVYATAWMESGLAGVGDQSIHQGDVQGFMETCANVDEDELDLILTSPGGSPDAAEAIMDYLRTQFTHIRVIVPVAAMSAATMMSLAADEIVMGKHSQLGPIDPQITVQTPEGPRSSPGQAILDQFELAKEQCKDPANLAAWLPMLRALLPGLISFCIAQRELAKTNAQESLQKFMFVDDPDAATKAAEAANYFSDFNSFKSHGRRVNKDAARAVHLKVTDLEGDKVLQDLVLSVHHAIRYTFSGAGVYKVIENHLGRAYIESQQQVQVVVGGPPGAPPPPGMAPAPALPAPALPAPVDPATGSRQQRRAAERASQKRKK